MKPSKGEIQALVERYGRSLHSAGYNEKAHLPRMRDACLADANRFEAQISAALSTLCDDAEQVEWVPVDGRTQDIVDLFVSDGKRVGFVERWHDIPKGTTHYAPCPPRRMPQPPKGGEKDV